MFAYLSPREQNVCDSREETAMRRALICLIAFVGPMVFAQVTSSGVAGIGGSFGGIRGVQGVPFSADVTTETTRILADGNRIHNEMHDKIYRDSEGRTRNENSLLLPNGETRQIVLIHDPIQHQTIHLDTQRKTADVFRLQAPSSNSQMPLPQIKPSTLPTFTSHLETMHTEGTSHHEKLGTMYIEGILAEGVKVTRTTPAGLVGNDQPIVVTSETWSSPELKEILLNKTEDPQNGENIRKLSNIQRGEPDPSLFQVPPGFTVQEHQ